MPTPVKILVVDDEKDFTKALEPFLANAGYTVHVANSGQEALDFLHEYRYELVLLDLHMPGLDGIHVAKVLKQTWKTQDVIIITGHKDKYEEQLKSIGITHIMEKPIGLKDLLQQVTAIVKPMKAEPTTQSVTSGIPKARLLFIESHDTVYDNLFAPYFKQLNADGEARYELVFADNKNHALAHSMLSRPDIILLNTGMLKIYPDLQKELGAIMASPIKEVIVHGIELLGKPPKELGLDPEKITAVEGGAFDMKYSKKLADAVKIICLRHGLVDGAGRVA